MGQLSATEQTRTYKSHLAGTVKHPNWMTIDIVAFDIHVDSAFRTAVSCHERPPGLDAAPQTAAVRGLYSMSQLVSKHSTPS